MEWLYIIVAILAIVVATYMRNRESMTNEDVLSEIQKQGTESTKKSQSTPVTRPIYGPKAVKGEDKEVKEKEDESTHTKSEYPYIYGPDNPMIPGTTNGGDESYFKVNTDLAKVFPTEGAPQPYLTDFSKIQG